MDQTSHVLDHRLSPFGEPRARLHGSTRTSSSTRRLLRPTRLLMVPFWRSIAVTPRAAVVGRRLTDTADKIGHTIRGSRQTSCVKTTRIVSHQTAKVTLTTCDRNDASLFGNPRVVMARVQPLFVAYGKQPTRCDFETDLPIEPKDTGS